MNLNLAYQNYNKNIQFRNAFFFFFLRKSRIISIKPFVSIGSIIINCINNTSLFSFMSLISYYTTPTYVLTCIVYPLSN